MMNNCPEFRAIKRLIHSFNNYPASPSVMAEWKFDHQLDYVDAMYDLEMQMVEIRLTLDEDPLFI